MPDRVRVTEGQMRLILFAVEHGFRKCEKGENLQAALASVHLMYRVDDTAIAPMTSAQRET